MPTVTGTIKDNEGVVLANHPIRFVPLSGVTAGSNYIVGGPTIHALTNGSGVVTQALEASDYRVEWDIRSERKSFTIAVPASGGPYDLHSITSSSLTFTYAYDPLYMLAADPLASWRAENHLFKLWNPDTSAYVAVWVRGQPGAYQIVFGS